MKTLTLTLTLLLACFSFSFAEEEATWSELKGDHFIVYYNGDSSFPTEVLRNSEKYYKRIARDLSYSRYSKFWQWDDRVKIYIYENQPDFVKLGNYPQWSEGIADYYKKAIYTYKGSEEFVTAILPHEITHLIFRDFVGLDNPSIPMWLDEGVAQWEEPKKRSIIRPALKDIYDNGKVMRLSDFMTYNIQMVNDTDKVRSYYIQAMSLVEFLMSKYGSDRFLGFCRDLRDGKEIERAFQSNYPTHIRNIEELENKYVEWIGKIPAVRVREEMPVAAVHGE
ncbi:MAG: peptidase MA family metallohydrolase [Candidatus Omnitrophota bacterium]